MKTINKCLAAIVAVVTITVFAQAGDLTNVKGPESAGAGPYTVTFTGTTSLAMSDKAAVNLTLDFEDSLGMTYKAQLNWIAPNPGKSTKSLSE
jgi:hypothetical protein